MSDHPAVRAEAKSQWDQARRKAMWSKMRSYVRREDDHLIDFEEISNRLGLRNQRYRGKQEVELDKIVGSVGRYNDFTSTFLPITAKMETRWEGVAGTFISSTGTGPPPVELYKVGESYFVKDGNHRCSVARQLGVATIEAYVWEYQVPGNREDADIDTLIVEAERADFLEATNLNTLRPHHNIALTLPGGYRDMLHQIARYRDVLQAIDEEEKSDEEAVTGWFDLQYEPIVQIINREKILDNFQERTPADLYNWVNRHHANLEESYGRQIRYTQAVQSLPDKHASPLQRFLNKLRSVLPFIA